MVDWNLARMRDWKKCTIIGASQDYKVDWDEMGWNGMGWDGVGWDRVGLVGRWRQVRDPVKAMTFIQDQWKDTEWFGVKEQHIWICI